MKKIITKFWGVALALILLSTLFVAAAPVSAADPLNWESKSDAPSTIFSVVAPGTNVIDYDVNGWTMYAITRTYSVTAVVTVAFNGIAGQTRTYTFTYTNDQGVAGRTGTVTFAGNAATTGTVALAAGDTGITTVQAVATTFVDTGTTATAGTFDIREANRTTVMANFTFAAGAPTVVAAHTGNDALMLSTFGGAMWTNITTRLPAIFTSLDYVAIAPDDPNIAVVVDSTPAAGVGAALTKDGGATWESMGIIQDVATSTPAAFLYGVAISPQVSGGFRYVSVFGRTAAAANGAALYYYNYGSGIALWRDALLDFTGIINAAPVDIATMDNIVAVTFSDNFPSDYTAVALSEDRAGAAAAGVLRQHILNFNSFNWDPDTVANAAVQIDTVAAGVGSVFTVNIADIALPPDYDGGDDATRISFIAASITDNVSDRGGLWRVFDIIPPTARLYSAAPLASVAYDGTNLAAGAYTNNNVVRASDALASSPTFRSAATLKRIGLDDTVGTDINDTVKVKFDVDYQTLYGAKRGDASALSKSTDYGATWNDFSLMDSGIANIDDLYVTAGGDPWYVSTHDNVSNSVFRVSMRSVTRVLTVNAAALPAAGAAAGAGNPDFMLRGIPTEPDLIYACDEGGTVMYYTNTGGLSRWNQRNSVPAAIADVAVESATVVYIGSGVNVYKSTSAGNTWNAPVIATTGANAVNQMISLGEGQVLLGGTMGGVYYTKDGGTSWTGTMGVFNNFSPVLVAATGLEAGDWLFAAEETGDAVYRWPIGGPMEFFRSMNKPTTALENNVGLVYKDGILYSLTDGGSGGGAIIARTLSPTASNSAGVHIAQMWGNEYPEAGILPVISSVSALEISSGAPGSIMLYTVAPAPPFFASDGVFYYEDTFALNGPTLIGPATGTLVQIVSPLTAALADVTFTWDRISLADGYQLQIAMDAGFNEQIGLAAGAAGTVTAGVAGGINSAADPVSSIQAGGLLFVPGNTYYWRVRAWSPTTSAWSETRTFTTQPSAASVPSISSPEIGSGTVQPTGAAFSWSPVAGASMYRFELSTSADFSTTVYATDVSGAGVGLPSNITLERGTTYFWRVKSLTPVESDWSTVANFMVAEEVVEPTIPPATTTEIVVPPGTTQIITVPPATTTEVNPGYIWAIIIIGAVLVIAVIVLIVRTRRSV